MIGRQHGTNHHARSAGSRFVIRTALTKHQTSVAENVLKRGRLTMTEHLYFSASEVMKGIRLLYSQMDFEMFKRELFRNEQHTEEYLMSKYRFFGESPFRFWCGIDDTKRQRLEFLIDEATNTELKREKEVFA